MMVAMRQTEYVLRPRSYGWREDRLVRFDVTVEHGGRPLGGRAVQVVLGAPGEVRRGLDSDVALTLDSGWWITLRNHFALAPGVAVQIIESVRDALNELTAEANEASAEATDALWRRLCSTGLRAVGPDYWP
jgi:hypothetical protein